MFSSVVVKGTQKHMVGAMKTSFPREGHFNSSDNQGLSILCSLGHQKKDCKVGQALFV
jgi:hypothetical protein